MENDNSGILKVRSILVTLHTRKILAESSDYFNITLLKKPNTLMEAHKASFSIRVHTGYLCPLRKRMTTNDRKEGPEVAPTSKSAQLWVALFHSSFPLISPLPTASLSR